MLIVDFAYTVRSDNQKQQIVKFKKLEPSNIWQTYSKMAEMTTDLKEWLSALF